MVALGFLPTLASGRLIAFWHLRFEIGTSTTSDGDCVAFVTASIEGTGSNIGARVWAFIPVVVVSLLLDIDRTTTKTKAIITNPAQ
jgi:hypothetical protein